MKRKTIFALGVFFLFNLGYAQTIPVDSDTKEALIKEVVEVQGTNQAELYERALAWINKFYPNPTGVIQSKDPSTGEIVGKAQFKLTTTDKKGTESFDGMVGYTITLSFKDGKFKYEITRIHWKQTSYYDVSKWMDTKSPTYKTVYLEYIKQTNVYFDNLKLDLKKAIKTPPTKKKDDW
jgi:hypothetical protein